MCSWVDVTSAFVVRGPGDSGWVRPNAIGLSRAPSYFPKAGIYRLKLVFVPATGFLPKIRCADVVGSPAVLWPLSCPPPMTEPGGGDFAEDFEMTYAYVFRIAEDCDGDGQNDNVVTPNPANCPNLVTCRVDFNQDGHVTVQDIFDFLSAWFVPCTAPQSPPGSPCFQSADFNGTNGITVQDIFDFLSAWFASSGMNCS
jgi:hypothetical protein